MSFLKVIKCQVCGNAWILQILNNTSKRERRRIVGSAGKAGTSL